MAASATCAENARSTQEPLQLPFHVLIFRTLNAWSGDYHNIPARLQRPDAHCLTNKPLGTVPLHSPTHFLANNEAKPTRIQAIPKNPQHNERARISTTLAEHTRELFSPSQRPWLSHSQLDG